jgi:hypothetical protein
MDSYRMSFPPELNTSRRHAAKTATAEPTIQADEILTRPRGGRLPEAEAARGLQLDRRAETQSQANQQPELPNPEKRSVPLYEPLEKGLSAAQLPRTLAVFLCKERFEDQVLF